MNFVTLDDEQFRQFANDDPAGFMRGLDRVVIDEVQRAPGLILALKKAVDEDPRPGRFLVTGSVDLFKGMISPDSLAGRVETIELLPFSQAEIERRAPSEFVTRAFEVDFSATSEESERTPDLIKRVVPRGGIPRRSRAPIQLVDRHGCYSRRHARLGKTLAQGVRRQGGARRDRDPRREAVWFDADLDAVVDRRHDDRFDRFRAAIELAMVEGADHPRRNALARL